MLNHKTIITITALCLVSLAGEIGKIAGKVIDSSTGKPLNGANVIVKGTDYGSASDQSGEYIILFVPVGSYQLTASYPGYKEATQENVVVTSNQITHFDFKLALTVVDTIRFGPLLTFIPADTTLPERYIQKVLFNLNWGNGPGEIGKILPPPGYGPSGLAVDNSGRIHILDIANRRIVVFDSCGKYISHTEIKYDWNKIRETWNWLGYGAAINLLTYLGFDIYSNYLIAADDGFIYTFDCDGNYLRRDTTDYWGANFPQCRNIEISQEYQDKKIVTIRLNDMWTKKVIKEIRLQPKVWVMEHRHSFKICNYDTSGNSYLVVYAAEKRDDKHNVERFFYTMLEKYNSDGRLLAQIQLEHKTADRTRCYVTSEGEIYMLFYNRDLIEAPVVTKWVLQKVEGEK